MAGFGYSMYFLDYELNLDNVRPRTPYQDSITSWLFIPIVSSIIQLMSFYYPSPVNSRNCLNSEVSSNHSPDNSTALKIEPLNPSIPFSGGHKNHR